MVSRNMRDTGVKIRRILSGPHANGTYHVEYEDGKRLLITQMRYNWELTHGRIPKGFKISRNGELIKKQGVSVLRLICRMCKTPFYRSERKMRYAAKHGVSEMFCSKRCASKAHWERIHNAQHKVH